MRYRRADHTAWRNLGDETVLVDLDANEMYGLNPTAGYLWQSLDGTVELAELAGRLQRPLGGIESFCDELARLGLIEAAEAGSAAADEAPLPDPVEPPRILWHEPIRQAAATCAFLPAQNPLCTIAPFS